MYLLDKQKAREILLEEGFKPYQVNQLLKRYPPVHDSLGPAIEKWLNERVVSEVVVDNISVRNVMELRHSHFLIAIRDLSQLLNPDLTTQKREQWRRIVTTPVFYE